MMFIIPNIYNILSEYDCSRYPKKSSPLNPETILSFGEPESLGLQKTPLQVQSGPCHQL